MRQADAAARAWPEGCEFEGDTEKGTAMGDIEVAKRNMRWVKMAIEDRRYDQLEERASKVEGDLEGVTGPEADGLRKELADARKQGEDAEKAEMAKRVEEEVVRNIQAADPQYNAPDRVESQLKKAMEMIESERGRTNLPPEAVMRLKGMIAKMRGESADATKTRVLDNVKRPLGELEEGLAKDPFQGVDGMAARRVFNDLAPLVKACRNILAEIADDADAKKVLAKVDALEKKLNAGWETWLKGSGVGRITESWAKVKGDIAGFGDERPNASWEAYKKSTPGMDELLMPKTAKALREAAGWLSNSFLEDAKKEYADDEAVKETIAEAKSTAESAAKALHRSFGRVLDDLESLRPPVEDKRELESANLFFGGIDRWFGGTAHLDENTKRAKALREKWEAALAKYEREGLELYQQMEKDAAESWPGIVKSLKFQEGFDPAKLDQWRGKTILLTGVRNRAGWDFVDYDFAMRINDVPVGGSYELNISNALRDAVRRTHNSVDDHKDWDLIAVVEGTGTLKKRVNRELRVEGTNEKIKTESWEPEPCVTLRIIALHAGPVAVGPR